MIIRCHASRDKNLGDFHHANSSLRGAATDLTEFFGRFSHLFKSKTCNLSFRAEQYLKGLLQAKKKNMERMAEAVSNSNDQAYQHYEFIEYQRKQDLALQLVIAARIRGAEFGWIGCDAFYGEDPAFFAVIGQYGRNFCGRCSQGSAHLP